MSETRDLERHGGGDHEEEEHAERPDVDGGARVGVVAEQFGSGVRRRAAERRQHVILGSANDARREAKVAETDVVRRCQEHVLRFDVAVVQVVVVLLDKKELSHFCVVDVCFRSLNIAEEPYHELDGRDELTEQLTGLALVVAALVRDASEHLANGSHFHHQVHFRYRLHDFKEPAQFRAARAS